MEITKCLIRKVVPQEGLVGFASFVIDDCLYLGNVAIFSRLNQTTYRLVFPEKKVKDKVISLFHPVSSAFYFKLEEFVNKEFNKIDIKI